jgi:hypothetical protein
VDGVILERVGAEDSCDGTVDKLEAFIRSWWEFFGFGNDLFVEFDVIFFAHAVFILELPNVFV